MASKAFRTPIIRHVVARGYAQAAPAARKEPGLSSAVADNKTFIAALDNGSPVTRITVAVKAGARFEPQAELGVSHVLRSAAGLSTGQASGYITSRKLAQIGGSINVSGDREFVYYTLETTQDHLNAALEYLNNVVSSQEFRPWELSENVPRLKYDIVSLPPQVRAVDLLHKAAFRRGLGNSLFISPKRIGKISTESVQHYTATNVTTARAAVAVVGGPLDIAKLVATGLKLGNGGESQAEAAKYYGGELRKEMGGDLTHVALAIQGAPAGSTQSLALAVAARALGSGPVAKWGNDNSQLAKAIGNVGPFASAGFNVSYSDSGLYGAVLSVPKDEAATAVKAVAKVLKSGSLSGDAIKAGKNQLKLQVLSEADAGASLAEVLAAQGLNSGSVRSPAEIANDIEKLSNSDISQALSNAGKSPLSIASVGNLAFVPYVDEL